MRLDAYLVELGNFKSRARSKQAIKGGHVKVDGYVITKPSKDVSIDDTIEVDEGLDMPKGYFKLKGIQEETDLIKEGDSIIDLGSSAGGFITFASDLAGKISGLEFSHDFRSELGQLAHENENVSIIFDDVFSVPLEELSEEPVDVIMSDMTLEPMDSLSALERILPLLKDGGKVLQVIKMSKKLDRRPVLDRMEELGIDVLDVLESHKQEIYVVGQKKGVNETME